MGALLKDKQRVALKFEGNGPLKKILVEATHNGKVRGYVGVPKVHLPTNQGKLDVAAALGAKVISPIEGTAVLRSGGDAGRVVGVVGEGYIIYFAHLGKRFFSTGDKVQKGDAVGTVGMTGRTSGPHVHVGYGLATPGPGGVTFGRHRYKMTDPKLFFYREQFILAMD